MKALLVLVSALLMTGCVTSGQSARDTAQQALEVACAGAPTASMAFDYYAATGRVNATVIRAKNDAMAALNAVCSDPPRDTVSALRAVSNALAAIAAAEAKAKAQIGT